MGAPVMFIFYASILFCVVAGIARIVTYARAPVHLRWELYQGGSVYELSNWWRRPHLSLRTKLAGISLDILFLRQYYRRNRSFWLALYPFHLGLYLLILWHMLIFVLPLAASLDSAPLLSLVWGHASTGLISAGSLAILIRRLFDAHLRRYYPAIHYVKWIFILVTLGGAYYAVYSHFGNTMPNVLAYVREQLAFHWAEKLSPPLLPSLHVLAVSVWLIYLPFSHMMQLFSRYYHELRWDHVPNLRGSAMERRVNGLLRRELSWSALHIKPGGTWEQAASRLPNRS